MRARWGCRDTLVASVIKRSTGVAPTRVPSMASFQKAAYATMRFLRVVNGLHNELPGSTFGMRSAYVCFEFCAVNDIEAPNNPQVMSTIL